MAGEVFLLDDTCRGLLARQGRQKLHGQVYHGGEVGGDFGVELRQIDLLWLCKTNWGLDASIQENTV